MRNRDLNTALTRAAWLWLFLILCTPVFSQITNINGGVVNIYKKVIDFIPAKACIRVSNTTGLTPGAKVLLVQMKGVTINTTNTAVFGDTTALNDAGNYEVSTICTIIGDSVFMVHSLLNTYSPAAGKVQLVQFGEYVSANVTGTITAAQWNNTAGTGGVIAIYVEEDLILNQSISADGNGFAGGAFVQSNTICTNTVNGYAYNGSSSSPQNGSYKGEGAADVVISQSGGRGAPANGGGGGNNHNNSGGGGSNLSRGGLGGGNSSSMGCVAAFKGEGGKALSSWNGKKIFLGGGGGAGHNNNAVLTFGGANGGGIIFIHANNIIGNGFRIGANGNKGGNAQADGAGGGGGGGSIILDVNTFTGSLTVEANGGAGGDTNDGGNIGRCYAGGGGGGGGIIYFSSPLLPLITSSVNAGVAGVELGRDASCNAAQPAAPGNVGQTPTGYNYRTSLSLAGYCAVILPSQLNFFRATPNQKKVTLQWEAADPDLLALYIVQRWDDNSGWTTITSVTNDDNRSDYTIDDNNPMPGYNLYRLKIIKKSSAVFYSPIKRAYIDGEQQKITVYPNPASNKLFIQTNKGGMATIRLLDISGKPVLQKTLFINTRTSIDLPVLPAGIYMLYVNESIQKLMIK